MADPVTIGDSSTATKAEIKALAEEQIVEDTGVTIASQADVSQNTSDIAAIVAGGGAGDMLSSVYDPTTVADDAFDMDNMVEGADTKILTATERSTIGGALQAADIADMVTMTSTPTAVNFAQTSNGSKAITNVGGYFASNALTDSQFALMTGHAVKVVTDSILAQINDPNLGTSFIMAVADNTLEAALFPLITPAFYQWQIVVDSTVAPIGTLANVSGTLDASYTLPDWNEHAYYLYVKRTDNAVIQQITPSVSDGETVPGFLLQARDTIPPVAITDFALSAGTDPNTQMTLSFTGTTDSGVGLKAAPYDLWTATNGTINSIYAYGVSDTDVISGLSIGTDYTFAIVATDKSGNRSTSNIAAITTGNTDSAGTFNLDDTTLTETEGTAVAIGVTRTNGSIGDVYIKLSTRDSIPPAAVDGTHYYGRGEVVATGELTNSGTTATWAHTGIGLTVEAGDYIHVQGATDAEYNGYWPVDTVSGDDSLTYIMSGTPVADIGTITIHTGVFFFADSDLTKSINILTIDTDSAYNNAAYYYLDNGGNSDGILGSVNSGIFTLNGTATTGVGYTQGALTPFEVLVEGESLVPDQVTSTDGNSDYWEVVGTDSKYSGSYIAKPNSTTEMGSVSALDTQAAYMPFTVTFNQTGEHVVAVRAERPSGAARRSVHMAMLRPIDGITRTSTTATVTLTENHQFSGGEEIHIEGATVADYDGTWTVATATPGTTTLTFTCAGTESTPSTAGGNLFGDPTLYDFYSPLYTVNDTPEFPSAAAVFYAWTQWNTSKVERTINIPAVGDWNFRIYQQDSAFIFDKLAMWKNGESPEYDPSTSGLPGGVGSDDYMGDVESVIGNGTTVIDNPNNATVPFVPLPATLVTPTVSPASAAGDVSVTSVITASFSGMTSIQVTISVTLSGETIGGAVNTVDGTVRFVPTNGLLSGALGSTYTATAYGTVLDAGGVLKGVNYSWSFTTIADILPAGILLNQDFSAFTQQTGLTRALMRSIWQSNCCDDTIYGTPDGYLHNGQDIVISPDSDLSRGYVMQCFHAKGSWNIVDPTTPEQGSAGPPNSGQWRPLTTHADSGTWGSMFSSVEFFMPVINEWSGLPTIQTKQMKLPVSFYGGNLAFEGLGIPDGTDGWSVRAAIFKTDTRGWIISDYLYYKDKAQVTCAFNGNYPTKLDPSIEPLISPVPGKWWKITMWIDVDDGATGASGKTRLWCGEVGKAQNLVYGRDGLEFNTTPGALPIVGGFALNGYGGNDPTFAAPQDQKVYFDNFIWRTSTPSDIDPNDLL